MLQISICDDSWEIREQLQQYLKNFSESSGIELFIMEFCSGPELLSSDYSAFDLLITDIQMPGLSGLETAREIRQTNQELTIIFFTNYIQYALEGYEVQAFRFILKPLSYEQFAAVVGKAILNLQARKKATIVVYGKEKSARIPVESILYVETEKGKGHVIIHTANGTIASPSSMKEMEQFLRDYMFFRCHTAYLVPLREIRSIDLQDLLLQNGERIPLSKHRRKALKEAITVFWGGRFL